MSFDEPDYERQCQVRCRFEDVCKRLRVEADCTVRGYVRVNHIALQITFGKADQCGPFTVSPTCRFYNVGQRSRYVINTVMGLTCGDPHGPRHVYGLPDRSGRNALDLCCLFPAHFG